TDGVRVLQHLLQAGPMLIRCAGRSPDRASRFAESQYLAIQLPYSGESELWRSSLRCSRGLVKFSSSTPPPEPAQPFQQRAAPPYGVALFLGHVGVTGTRSPARRRAGHEQQRDHQQDSSSDGLRHGDELWRKRFRKEAFQKVV